MYGVAASLLVSQWGGWLVGQGVYTITEYLLYQIIQLWIYEKSKNAGILDPNAPPFFPHTEQVPEKLAKENISEGYKNPDTTEQHSTSTELQHDI